MKEKIVVASDHAGYDLKEHVKSFLETRDIDTEDVGTGSDESVDYPDFGGKAAELVSRGTYERGILICGSGVGMSIVANKYPNVRAVLALDSETARMSRLHNNSNVLVLAGRRTGPEYADEILTTWLETPFEGDRHQRRLEKISKIEEKVRHSF